MGGVCKPSSGRCFSLSGYCATGRINRDVTCWQGHSLAATFASTGVSSGVSSTSSEMTRGFYRFPLVWKNIHLFSSEFHEWALSVIGGLALGGASTHFGPCR